MIVTTYYLTGIYDKKVTTIHPSGVIEIQFYLTKSESDRLIVDCVIPNLDIPKPTKESWWKRLLNFFRKNK